MFSISIFTQRATFLDLTFCVAYKISSQLKAQQEVGSHFRVILGYIKGKYLAEAGCFALFSFVGGNA